LSELSDNAPGAQPVVPTEEAGESHALPRAHTGGETLRRGRIGFGLAVAVVSTAGAAGVDFAIHPLTGGRYAFQPFFAALIVTALYGGLRAGLLAVGLSMATVGFFWMEPAWHFAVVGIADQVSLAIFCCVGTFMVILVSRLPRAGAEASQARHNLGAITDAMACGVARCSRDLRYLWVSKRYPEFLGRLPDEIVGRTVPEVLGPQLFEIERPYIERVLAGEPVTFERKVVLPNREPGWICTAHTPQRDHTGQVDSWVSVMTDITRLKNLEESLRQADRRKDEFLATLAHELRNPLAPIRYCARLLQLDAGTQAVERARETIERQVSHMTRLLDDLLDVSRVTRNVIELRLEPVELRRAIEQALEVARPAIDGAHHRLAVSMAGEPLWIQGDRTRVAQILGNLLQNAAKYTDPGGRIEVSLETQAGSAVIRVRDNGIGIPPEKRNQVFELFSQIHSSRSGGHGGLGIGLAVVKHLVELHGGAIEVRSAGQGQGSEFSVRLPLVTPPVTSARATAVTRLHGSARRVLLVDDNADVVDSLAAVLRSLGYLAHTATDGATALTIAETIHPDVIVLDLGMPDTSGYDVAYAVRRQPGGAHVQLIAATGWGSQEDRRRTLEAGFDAHLTKPLNPDELIRLIESHAEAARCRA
jgi:PAS domain S-box-containing protein